MSNQNDHTIVRLRVPPELKEQIEQSAEANNRSQSAEMVSRLEASFERQSLEKVDTLTLIMELVERFPKETFTINLDDTLREELLNRSKSSR